MDSRAVKDYRANTVIRNHCTEFDIDSTILTCLNYVN